MNKFCRFYAILAGFNTFCGLQHLAAGTFDDPMTHSAHIVSFGITAALGAWALYASAKG